MANKEVKLIDAELLTTNIAQIAKACAKSDKQKALVGRILFMIDNMPTIETEPVNGWISVKDRLPEPYESVLVFGNSNDIVTYRVDYLDDYGRWFRTFYVTHWQYLPEPPKGE